jgi:hypothetical protein
VGVVGTGDGSGRVGWMLLLGALMALEKNAPRGRKLRRPLGAALDGLGGSDRRRRLRGEHNVTCCLPSHLGRVARTGAGDG